MGQNIPTATENRLNNNQYELIFQARHFDEIAGIYNVFRNGRNNINEMENENDQDERSLAWSRRTVARGLQRHHRVEKETPTKETAKGCNIRRHQRFHTIIQIKRTDNLTIQSYKVFYSDGDWTFMTRDQLKKEHPTQFIDFLLSQRQY